MPIITHREISTADGVHNSYSHHGQPITTGRERSKSFYTHSDVSMDTSSCKEKISLVHSLIGSSHTTSLELFELAHKGQKVTTTRRDHSKIAMRNSFKVPVRKGGCAHEGQGEEL